MIVLELQKYWKRFRAFSDIFSSALRLTCTGSYRIIQRCFSERTSRLRGYFKNVQLRLYFCLVWSSGDVSLVYGSSGRETFSLKLVLFFFRGTRLPFSFKTALGLSWDLFAASLSLFTSPSPSLLSLCSLPHSLFGCAATNYRRSTTGAVQLVKQVEETLENISEPPKHHLSGRKRPSFAGDRHYRR